MSQVDHHIKKLEQLTCKTISFLHHLLASEEFLLLPPFLFLLLSPLLLSPLALLLFLTLRPEFSISPLLLELKGKH